MKKNFILLQIFTHLITIYYFIDEVKVFQLYRCEFYSGNSIFLYRLSYVKKFIPLTGRTEKIDFKMTENESVYGTTLSQESMKVIAESIGIGNLPDEAAKDLAEDVSYKLKEIIQVCSF